MCAESTVAVTHAIRDPTDRWILATAIAGDTVALVTGDPDLLDVRSASHRGQR